MHDEIMVNADGDLLAWLAERCQRNLAANHQAQEYLRRNGASEERVWAAFRLGIGSPSLMEEAGEDAQQGLAALGLLPKKGQHYLHPNGIIIPTFMPKEPQQPVALTKLCYGQNKHSFITRASGVGCAPDVDEHKRVIITDTPLLALRLAQAGAQGVVLAEQPEVLAPLLVWLAGRDITLASYKQAGLAALKSALGALAERAKTVQVHTELLRSNPETLECLGIHVEPPTVTPLLVGKIMDYAAARLANGHGADLLRELQADDPEFVRTYGIGYLPPDFFDTLDTGARRLLRGKVLTDALIVPAFDEGMNPVDMLFVRSGRHRENCRALRTPPAGLLAPKVATASSQIIVADSLEAAARLSSFGNGNVLLLRGPEDAKSNAKRLAAAGVQRARVVAGEHAKAIVAALSEVGIAAEAPADSPATDASAVEGITGAKAPMKVAAPAEPFPCATAEVDQPSQALAKPTLVKHDPKTETAVFNAGDSNYHVEVTVDGGTRLQVRLERDGKVALDRFDFAVAQQRRRYAMSAAMKTQVPYEQIESHLVHILDEVTRLQHQLQNPLAKPQVVFEMSAEQREEALALLKRPDLLEGIAADLEALGWVGEAQTKRLLYLTAISRKLPMPLSAALLSSSGAGKSLSIESIALLTPPEELLHVSRLTDSALYYHDKDSLRHKLLVIDESDSLTPEVLVSLRVLQTRGALSQTHVLRDPTTGMTTTQFIEARGPVAVLTCTAGELEEQVLSRCFEVAIDESPEQTARVLDAQRRLRADPDYAGADGRRANTVLRHHALQRLLVTRPVLIPFASRIQFPSSSVRHRREQERFLNLIEASSLLHQQQRLRHRNSSGEEFIIADMRDYAVANNLAADSIGRASDELSVNARDVLTVVQGAGLATFDINQLKALRPEWTRHRFRAGLDELLSLEIISSPKRSRPRRYRLHPSAAVMLAAPQVRLLPATAFGDLATFGETGFAISSPRAATG